jgi:FMN phosphatase YigB (HAD superfamily)
MPKTCTLSFDLDGTLTTPAFVDGVWTEGIPLAWAAKNGTSPDEAHRHCIASYRKVGEQSIHWYQLPYWLDLFGLSDLDPLELVDTYVHRLGLFDDVIPVLESLRTAGRRMLIFSNATRIFLDAEVTAGGIAEYFDQIISVPDDWGMVKADPESFTRLRGLTGPIVHVGDQIRGDYESPRSLGIPAYHIWRGSGERCADSLPDLFTFARHVHEDIEGIDGKHA